MAEWQPKVKEMHGNLTFESGLIDFLYGLALPLTFDSISTLDLMS